MTPLMVIGVVLVGLDGMGWPVAGFGWAGIGSAVPDPPLDEPIDVETTGAAGAAAAGAGSAPVIHAVVSMRNAAFTIDPPEDGVAGRLTGRPISPWPATRPGRPVWVRNLVVPAGFFHPRKTLGARSVLMFRPAAPSR